MVSYQEDNWEGLQFEHVDWNDIVEAELGEEQSPLVLLKERSVEMQKTKTQMCCPSRSYAQVVSPLQQGTKRTISERAGLSPIEYCSKRSVRSKMDGQRYDVQRTPPNSVAGYESPDSGYKTNSGPVQRRLFPSPNTGQLTPARPISSPDREVLTPHRLTQRQKQIDFGKNTIGYQKYIQTVPRWQRNTSHPVTPDKHKAASTRAWQGQIRVWRRALHKFDPPSKDEDAFTPMEASLCEM